MLAGENGFYDEFRLAQANLIANVTSGRCQPGVTSSNCKINFAYMGPGTGTSPLPIFMAYFAGIPLNDSRNQNPASYTSSNFRSSNWYNSVRMYNPSLSTIAGSGSSGLRQSGLAANAAAAGLPSNFFVANPSNYQANNYMWVNGGPEAYHGLQFEFRRRMAQGFMVQASYALALSQTANNWRSLREEPIPTEGTRTPVHNFKFNFIFELPFGRGKPFGSGVSRGMDALIGGWEIDGVFKYNTGPRFNYGGYRLVGMTEDEFQKMFKFYHRVDSSGKERIYMLPEDVINNSIIAIYGYSASSPTGLTGTPTGRYLAPASGFDCVQYLGGMCPGTSLARIITGPGYAKFDMSFVKRIAVWGNSRIEARMDLYNITNAINFIPLAPTSITSTAGMGAAVTNWQVTGAARDVNASQDMGGRVTSFGLRFTW